MGDRYHIPVVCPKCSYSATAYYAPTSGFLYANCRCGHEFDLEQISGIPAESTANTIYGLERIRLDKLNKQSQV